MRWLLVKDSRRLIIVLGWNKGRFRRMRKKSFQIMQCSRLLHCWMSKNNFIPQCFLKIIPLTATDRTVKAVKCVYWSVKHDGVNQSKSRNSELRYTFHNVPSHLKSTILDFQKKKNSNEKETLQNWFKESEKKKKSSGNINESPLNHKNWQ